MINQSAEGSATTTHRALRTRIVIIPVESPSRIFSGLEPQIRNVDVARRDDVTLGIVDIVACSVDWTVEPTILSIGRPGRQQQKHNEGRHDLNYPPPRHLGQIADNKRGLDLCRPEALRRLDNDQNSPAILAASGPRGADECFLHLTTNESVQHSPLSGEESGGKQG